MGMTHKEIKARNKKIIKAYMNGETSTAIAERYGLTRARVQQVLAAADNVDEVYAEHKANKHNNVRNLVNKAVSEKLSYKQMAEKYGHNQSYWRTWVHRLGLEDEVYTALKQSADKQEEIVAYLNEGHTQNEAAKKFGLAQGRISAIAMAHGIRRRYTGETLSKRNAEIIEKAESGVSAADLAEEYDLSYASIINILTYRNEPTERDDENREERNNRIAKMIEDGCEPKDIVAAENVSIYIVYNIAKERGLTLTSSRPTSKEVRKRNRQIVKDYKNGWSGASLARKYGLAISTVYAIIAKAGAQRNRENKDES